MKVLGVIVGAILFYSSSADASDVGASDILVNKILFVSTNYTAIVADRGEIWVKINRSVSTINTACVGTYSENGYLVAAFSGDASANQYLSGLLTAKTTNKTIRIGVDDSRKNSRSMCFLSYYEMD